MIFGYAYFAFVALDILEVLLWAYLSGFGYILNVSGWLVGSVSGLVSVL